MTPTAATWSVVLLLAFISGMTTLVGVALGFSASDLAHGALDWLFPVKTARMSRGALEMAGARVVYREIADLSHTYPRDENPRILDCLLAPVSS